MSLLKKFAVLALVAGSFFATGCATVSDVAGGAADAGGELSGDALLERDVTNALSAEPDLTGVPITVSCVNGVITLNGTVNSQLEKDLAERVASGVAGVVSVTNGITTNTGS